MALLEMFKDQSDESVDLDIENDFCPLKDQTLIVTDFDDYWQKTWASRGQTSGGMTIMTFSVRLWHAPRGMQ